MDCLLVSMRAESVFCLRFRTARHIVLLRRDNVTDLAKRDSDGATIIVCERWTALVSFPPPSSFAHS